MILMAELFEYTEALSLKPDLAFSVYCDQVQMYPTHLGYRKKQNQDHNILFPV